MRLVLETFPELRFSLHLRNLNSDLASEVSRSVNVPFSSIDVTLPLSRHFCSEERAHATRTLARAVSAFAGCRLSENSCVSPALGRQSNQGLLAASFTAGRGDVGSPLCAELRLTIERTRDACPTGSDLVQND